MRLLLRHPVGVWRFTARPEGTATEGERNKRLERRLRRLAVGVAGATVLVAGFLVVTTWSSPEVAANFTRVGGATRVETAVEAGRFWLEPPRRVFMTPATARRQVMLRAAECAMMHDAPVLFTSPTRQRQRKVDALRRRWETQIAELKKPWRLVVTYVTTEYDYCTPGRATDRVRILTDNAGLVPGVPSMTVEDDLESVVVFAASKTPRSPADVTVGVVLAAHLGTWFDRNVSLVILPRYIGADLRLDQQLRDQRDVVSRGVVVGKEGSIPEDPCRPSADLAIARSARPGREIASRLQRSGRAAHRAPCTGRNRGSDIHHRPDHRPKLRTHKGGIVHVIT
jgi:hypothetical protein